MKKAKFIVVIFYKDGNYERFDQDCGLGIDMEKVDEVKYIYVATTNKDAEFAIEHYTKKFADYDKELQEMS